MKTIFREFGFLLVEIIGGAIAIYFAFSLLENQMILQNSVVSADNVVIGVQANYDVIELDEADFEVKNDILSKGSIFEWQDYVKVKASDGTDLINYVSMVGNVDTSQAGAYPVTFALSWNGNYITKNTVFYVEE